MRLYVPATLTDLRGVTDTITLGPRRVHAATDELTNELATDGVTDIEEIEYVAHLAAAHDSLMAIIENPDVPWRRLVISVDVPDHLVGPVSASDDDTPASARELIGEALAVPIVCVHVDEIDAAAEIEKVLGGDHAAIDDLVDRELLWYDVSEIPEITADLD